MDDLLESDDFRVLLRAYMETESYREKRIFSESITDLIRENCAPKWQTIDTAPKDRDVLLFLPNSKPTIAVGFYLEEFGGDLITHWMPLPDAPKVENGKP